MEHAHSLLCSYICLMLCNFPARSHFGFRTQTYLWFLGLPKVEWETKLLPCGISSQFGFKINKICFLKFKVGSVVYASSLFCFLSHTFLQVCMDSSAAAGSINLPGIYCYIVCFFFSLLSCHPSCWSQTTLGLSVSLPHCHCGGFTGVFLGCKAPLYGFCCDRQHSGWHQHLTAKRSGPAVSWLLSL